MEIRREFFGSSPILENTDEALEYALQIFNDEEAKYNILRLRKLYQASFDMEKLFGFLDANLASKYATKRQLYDECLQECKRLKQIALKAEKEEVEG